MTLSAKTSLMLEVHKAGFRREGHKWCGEENKWCGEENTWCRERTNGAEKRMCTLGPP